MSSITVGKKPLMYRCTAIFQYRENYGAHCWDGEGACPQGWKNKGTHFILLADGLTSEMINDEGFMLGLSHEGVKHEDFNDYVEYIFHGLEVELSSEYTYRQKVDAYCDAHVDLDEEVKPEIICTPQEHKDDRYMSKAELMGYEA